MAAGPGRLTPPAASAGLAGVLALVGCATALLVHRHDTDAAEDQQRQATDVVLTRFEGRTAVLVSALEADPVVMPPTEPVSRAITAVVRVSDMPGRATPQALYGALPAGFDTAGMVTAARTAMEVARDTGEPRGTALPAGAAVIAVAEYGGTTPPSSTAQRRAGVTSWRLALIDPQRLMSDVALPEGASSRLSVADPAPPSKGSVTSLVAGLPWRYALELPRTARVSFGAVAVLLLSLLSAGLMLLTGVRSRRDLEREREATSALERETRTVAELGPLLQSSLDLAEVLPAVAIRLSDEFGLSRLAVQLHGEHGRLVDVFALGGRSGALEDEVELGAGTEHLPADVPATLPLQRAGRTIGRLSLTSRRPLQQAQVAALSAAADLIAVATYNVELYEREQASVRRLRDLDQLKDGFLSTISHELRTPITAIGGFVRLLRDRWDQTTEEQRLEFLDRVHRNSVSLGLLVDDLLDFARLERQALNAPASPMELDEHIGAVVAQLSPILGDREVTTELEPVRALANAAALERVVANLLTNANKFSPPGSPVVVRVRAQAETATLEVLDEGPGIAPEDRDHVFTRFYRGDSSAARGTRGAGIGLAVVRELVHQMGGQVVALPNTPHGTRMVVTLGRDLPAEQQAHPGVAAPTTQIVRSS